MMVMLFLDNSVLGFIDLFWNMKMKTYSYLFTKHISPSSVLSMDNIQYLYYFDYVNTVHNWLVWYL